MHERMPEVRVTLENRRLGMHRFAWRRLYDGAEADAPVAACITDAGTLIRARNDGGDVDVARTTDPAEPGASFSSWSNVASATAGTAVALAAVPGEVVLLYLGNSGRDLTVRTSADDGVSWSAPSVLYTESSAIDDVALSTWNGFNGDLAAFYVRGADVLHVRRSSGAWGGSGTVWPHGSDVSSLSGVGAWHDGADFQVAVTGVASPSGKATAWAASVGDFLGIPDVWTGLVSIVETDAGSTVAFDAPDGFSVFADPWVELWVPTRMAKHGSWSCPNIASSWRPCSCRSSPPVRSSHTPSCPPISPLPRGLSRSKPPR